MFSPEKKNQFVIESPCAKIAEIIVTDIVNSLENNFHQVQTILDFFRGPKGDVATQYFMNKYFGLIGKDLRDARIASAMNESDLDVVELKTTIIAKLKIKLNNKTTKGY